MARDRLGQLEIPPAVSYRGVLFRLNTAWHRPALTGMALAMLAQWIDLLVRAIQLHVVHRDADSATGFLGVVPPEIDAELCAYVWALVVLVSIWVLRVGLKGEARRWWMLAFWFQFFHHIEHAIILGRRIVGHDLLERSAASHYLFGPPIHLHFLFASAVCVTMVLALVHHRRPSPEDEAQHNCHCAAPTHRLSPVPPRGTHDDFDALLLTFDKPWRGRRR